MGKAPNVVSGGPDDCGEWREVIAGEKFIIRTSVKETAGRYTVIEITAEPRNGVPMHVHAEEEEHFIVLEGNVHLVNGDQTSILSAGDSATVKRGTPHAWGNLSDENVRMLIIFSPGDMEEVFRHIGSSDAGHLAAIAESAERSGTVITGPPPFANIYSVMSPRPAR